MKKKNIIIGSVIGIVILIVGIVIGYFALPQSDSPTAAVSSTPAISTASSSSGYALLDGGVVYNSTEHFIVNFEPLRIQMTNIQKQYSEPTYVYFEYLNNTASIGLNSRTLFTAASTIKVPLAMAVYKMAEEGKLKMTDTYTLQQSDLDDNFGDLYKVGAGQSYTIEQLVSIMLENSDNTAMNALLSILKNIGITDPFADVYDAMGWDYPPDFGTAPSYINIDLHTLSNMFTSLYEATYDNVPDSQAMLSYLTQTPFHDEIVAGVPSGITVAHKIGVADQNNTFSDCGIVYAPSRPYLLCVGSTGADTQTADRFISQVSKITYQYIINN